MFPFCKDFTNRHVDGHLQRNIPRVREAAPRPAGTPTVPSEKERHFFLLEQLPCESASLRGKTTPTPDSSSSSQYCAGRRTLDSSPGHVGIAYLPQITAKIIIRISCLVLCFNWQDPTPRRSIIT